MKTTDRNSWSIGGSWAGYPPDAN